MGRWTNARAAARAVLETPRGLETRAALRATEGHGSAPDAWRKAALAWWEKGHSGSALRCLDRARAADAKAVDHWRYAGWAWREGGLTRAKPAWQAALAMDPSGARIGETVLDVGAWGDLASVAEEAEAWPVAAMALKEGVEADPTQGDTRWALGDVLARRLKETDAARRVWSELAEGLQEEQIAGEREAWQVWLDVADLDETPDAAVLQRAVDAGFLHAEAWRGVLSRSGSHVGHLQGVWGHLARTVGGDGFEAFPGPAPALDLNAEELDALHPGGRGWFAALRRTLEPVAPPDRSDLLRGLETLERDWPEAVERVAALCAALGMSVPQAYLYRGEGAWGAAAWALDPPVLLVGREHAPGGMREISEQALSFLLAVELVHLAADHPILQMDTSLVGTSRSVYAAFGRYAGAAENVVELVTLLPGVDQIAKLERLMRVTKRVFRARTALDSAAGIAGPWLASLWSRGQEPAPVGREGLAGAALQFRIQADRAALLLTGDLGGAVEAILSASSTSFERLEQAKRDGLAAVLRDTTDPLPAEEAVRLTALVSFGTGAWA